GVADARDFLSVDVFHHVVVILAHRQRLAPPAGHGAVELAEPIGILDGEIDPGNRAGTGSATHRCYSTFYLLPSEFCLLTSVFYFSTCSRLLNASVQTSDRSPAAGFAT